MEGLLLTTKVRVPPQHHHVVRRLRLIDDLEQRIPDHKVTMLSAPAGYGKTTLLSQWANASRFPIAWLSIGEEDNDLEHFFRYLLAAWQQIQPGIEDTPLGIMLSAMEPDSRAVLSAFINAASEAPSDIVFVLDDFHLVKDPDIHQALAFLIDHLPPALHFVLAGRGEPALPLARYRARRELAEFHALDLQFLQEETSEFLNRVMGLSLSGDEVVELQSQLEGWIAGIQLAALSLRRDPAGPDKIVVSGRHRFIADYLSQDILTHLPEEVRRFLLQTGILERLCAPLCDALTASDSSREMLRLLERENLFLVPLDNSREWFRYHRLFADFLRDELDQRYPGEAGGLHRLAAQWYLAHDMPDDALHHAVQGADGETAARIFDKYTNAKLNTGELRTIKRWLDSVPEEWVSAYTLIGLAQVGYFAFSGAFADCVRYLGEVEQRLVPAQNEYERRQLAKVTAVRCALACIRNEVTQTESYASQALQDLRREDDSSLHLVYGALGDSYRRTGRWDDARRCYLTVLDLPSGPAYRFHSVHAFGALADLELRQGHLRDAATYWRKALAGIQDRATWGELPLPLIGWVYIRLGEVLYERNDLVAADAHVSSGLERAELGGDVRAMIAGYLIAGRLRLTASEVPAAAQFLERTRPLIETAHFPDWMGRFERFQVEVWQAQGMTRTAVDWAEQTVHQVEAMEEAQGEAGDENRSLAAARALIASGDTSALDRALALLAHLVRSAEVGGRTGLIIEALALQALALARRGDQAVAMPPLERALRLAEPEGYVRLFADLGLPMARLLQEARSRNVIPDYVDTLLGAFTGSLPLSTSDAEALPEPLSSREQEVLELMAAGLTNKEIAERLIISSETAKKHVANICAKLGVGNRTEAVARARELNFLR